MGQRRVCGTNSVNRKGSAFDGMHVCDICEERYWQSSRDDFYCDECNRTICKNCYEGNIRDECDEMCIPCSDNYIECDMCGDRKKKEDIYIGTLFNPNGDEIKVFICKDCLDI